MTLCSNTSSDCEVQDGVGSLEAGVRGVVAPVGGAFEVGRRIISGKLWGDTNTFDVINIRHTVDY